MNPGLQNIHPYPFERLASLLADVMPPSDKTAIRLTVGEPRHLPPRFVLQTIEARLDDIDQYPATKGMPELRQAQANWLMQRFNVEGIQADSHVLPVNGTREALFAIAQTVIAPNSDAMVLFPNPFYQIYEGAALLAGAEPFYLNCDLHGQVDLNAVPEHVWQRCQLFYLCTPGNPTGATWSLEQLQQLIQLSDQYDFVIASDECYSEIWLDEAPLGLMDACTALNRADFKNCLVFHSLSKRSNLPGLRSGFVAGDAHLILQFLRYRTYHGCAMPVHHQYASIAAWSDEAHVVKNRDAYRRKFDTVLPILENTLPAARPAGGFYLWPKTPIADDLFAQQLVAQENVIVLPGSYLSRLAHGVNPGAHRVRISLVATEQECVTAAKRIRNLVEKGL